ncbi:MAG TPA: hypothetical protein VF170_08530 [Planctomycetaceae bacterium]
MTAVELAFELMGFRPMTPVAVSVSRAKGREVYVPPDLTVRDIVERVAFDQYGEPSHGEPAVLVVDGKPFTADYVESSEFCRWKDAVNLKGPLAVIYASEVVPAATTGGGDRRGFVAFPGVGEETNHADEAELDDLGRTRPGTDEFAA